MRKIIYIGIAAFSILFASCNDFLGTESVSKVPQERAFGTLYHAEAAVMGVYDRMADAQMYAQRVSLNWSTNSDIEFVGADAASYNQATNRGVSNYFGLPGNSVLDWGRIYQMIERANLAEEGLRESPLMQGTARERATMKALLGEVLTLRAIGYYEMIKLWGDIPFRTEPSNPDLSNVFLPKTDRDTICNHLIKDLLEAETYLPWMGQSSGSISYSTAERVTKGFVKGMIARICLTRGGYALRDKPGFPTERGDNWEYYYQLANQKCKEIQVGGVHNLNPTYAGVWQKVNAMEQDLAYKENLYEVALGLGHSGEIGYSIGVRFYQNSRYGFGNNSNVVNTSTYYFYSFDREDDRRDATVALATYSNAAGDLKEIFTNNILSYNIAKWDQRWMSKNATWLAYNQAANNKWGYGVNWIVMRYSDILLMLAETENAINGPNTIAKDALKAVRARAFVSSPNKAQKVNVYVDNLGDATSFQEAIINERAWEFGGEAIRKFDLIRWNLLVSKIQEQRDAIETMTKSNSVTIFGNEYNNLPTAIYYKYKDDKENLDRANINFYEPNTELDALTDAQLKDLGYTKIKWTTAWADKDKTDWLTRVNRFSSGLLKVNNGACDNRHLYPIQSSVISDSRGSIKNSYGF